MFTFKNIFGMHRFVSVAALLLVSTAALPVLAVAQVTLIPYGAAGYRYAITTAAFPPIGAVVVPYGSSGYRYAITTGGFPVGVELPNFDDSAYAIGPAPFSNGTGPGIYTGNTYWPANTNLVARLRFQIVGAPRPTTLRLGIDNDATVFVNGTLITAVTHGGANYDDFTVPVPAGILQSGDNLLVVLAVDRGGDTAMDVALSTGVELTDFDDSQYATGTAPFSDGTGPGIYTGNTHWPENTKLIARLHFDVPIVPYNAVLRFGVDNDVTLFINGSEVGAVTHEGTANFDDFSIAIADGILHMGGNLLVALVVDRGGDTAFDASLTAEGATPALERSWGRIKVLYR